MKARKWSNPGRKVRRQIKDLGEKVTGLKLGTYHRGISVKIYSASCYLSTKYKFMCEMKWLTVHLLYMRELNKEKIHLGDCNL